MKVGERHLLQSKIEPENARRNDLIFVSETPELLSVDKFGELHAKAKGMAKITIYSWSDAEPRANHQVPEFKTNGIQAHANITIE